MAALDSILEAWLLVHETRISFNLETIKSYSLEMFNKYLQCHLSWAAINGGGIRTDPNAAQKNSFDDDTHDTGDDEPSDYERFEEQLIIIGKFGREKLIDTLPTLSKLLEERTQLLREQLFRIFNSNNVTKEDLKILEVIYDDILWILMVGANVIAMRFVGEGALIPSEVRKVSREQKAAGCTDLTATLKLLASPGQNVSEIPNAEQSADLVIRFIAAVFRLCDVENKAIELKMNAVLSPELSKNIAWFLLMWSESYLLFSSKTHDEVSVIDGIGNEISESLEMAFGIDTDGGKWTVDFILNKICVNVKSFCTEPQVVNTFLEIFVSLVKNKQK